MREASVRALICAKRNASAWCSASGWPNVLRCIAYSSASSIAFCAVPTERGASLGERALGLVEALALFADQRVRGHDTVFHHDLGGLAAAVADGLEHLADAQAGAVVIDDERADALVALGEDHEVVRL